MKITRFKQNICDFFVCYTVSALIEGFCYFRLQTRNLCSKQMCYSQLGMSYRQPERPGIRLIKSNMINKYVYESDHGVKILTMSLHSKKYVYFKNSGSFRELSYEKVRSSVNNYGLHPGECA